MRLRPRPTVKETISDVPERDNVPFHGTDMPHKAQKLLGTKVQVNVSNSRDNRREDFAKLQKLEQKNPGMRFTTQKAPQIPLPSLGAGLSDMPSWSTATAASQSSSDILSTPTASPGHPAAASRNGSSTGVQPSQFYPDQQQSFESLSREYYDPSKQPLYVSQQTSASAVRDMALHKGSPKVHQIANHQMSPKLSSPVPNAITQRNETQKKPKKLDIHSLFPRPNASSTRLLSPSKVSASPSAMTENTEFFPQETMRAELRRQGANGRFETHKSPVLPSSEAASTPRVKIFEADIYDNTKTHSKKPPKGIKNWFDGFDISSDEDENEPVELPADPPRPSVEGMPSDFSPYGVKVPPRTSSYGVYSGRAVQSNALHLDPAKTVTRQRMESRGSESSTVTDDSGAVGGQKRSGESRFTHSRLDSQSVLSLSSESEEERELLSPVRDSRCALEEGETLGPNLPSPVPRQLQNPPGKSRSAGLRISESTEQTSGTIPIRLRDSTAAPMAVEDWTVPAEATAVSAQSPKLVVNGAVARESKSRSTVRSGQDREGLKSAGGETSSSVPSDASRVMAVTEEEMMLLELMRSKRAAMQNNSFREGYRLALKQEQDYLSKRRQSAHNSVHKMVEERSTGAMLSPPPEKAKAKPAKKAEPQEQPPLNRYSVFQRIPGVEKGYNIDRYLAAEAPQQEPPLSPNALSDVEQQDEPERYVAKMARMERFLMMKPSLADAIYDRERPVSGTEIDTDTMTAATEEEDAPSPMARLAGMGHDRFGVISPPLDDHEDDDDMPEESDAGIDEHHKKVRAFLQSSRPTADASLTALPQMGAPEDYDDSVRSSSMLSPTLEEDPESELLTPRPPFVEPEQPIPQPTSKFQDRSRLAVAPDAATTELLTNRTRPPSVSTGFTSPLSQSFSTSTPENALTEGSRSPAYPRSPYLASTARRINKLPTKIDTTASKTKTVNRITSMSSMTSAGEDVLAAWAELGGGRDALGVRRGR